MATGPVPAAPALPDGALPDTTLPDGAAQGAPGTAADGLAPAGAPSAPAPVPPRRRTASQAGAGEGGGPSLEIGLSAGLAAHDNIRLQTEDGDGSVSADARLDFAYTAATDAHRLRLSGDVGLRGVNDGDSDDDLDGLVGPALRFSYDRAVPTTALEITGFARRSRIAVDDPLLARDGADDPLTDPLRDDDDADDGDEGIRLGFGLSGRLELRRDAPFGVTLRAGLSGARYSDGSERDDEDRSSAGALLRFDLDRSTRATLDLGYAAFEDDDDDARTLSAALGLSRAVRGGARYGLSLDVADTEAGDRYGLSLTHSRRGPVWALDGRVGLSRAAGGGNTLVGGLEATRDLARGQVSLSLERSLRTGEDEAERAVTTLGAAYAVALTERLDLSARASYLRDAAAGDGADDVDEAASAGVALTRSFDGNLTLTLGLDHRLRDDDRGRADDTALSLRLRRGFTFRP